MTEPLLPPRTSTAVEIKLKNSFALIILLLGLFVGSLFVDIGQLITGSGFSGSALRSHTVVETGGKTWVAYTEPAIPIKVVTDKTCLECNPDEALLWMRRILPTLRATEIAADSFEGKALILKHNLLVLPAFIFDSAIQDTELYAEATPLFTPVGDELFFDMQKIGLPVGKYLQAPPVGTGDIRLGNLEAKTTVTIFTDFACAYCQEFHATFKTLLNEYGDRVQFVFKHFPLPSHPQAPTAALAASCADAQGAFLAYSDLLFARQNEWAEKNDATTTLKNYAWRVKGLSGRTFATCLEEEQFKNALDENHTLAERYSLQAAPAIFVGSEFVSGAIPKADLEVLINEALTNQ